MLCPKCGCDNDKVIDSRSIRGGAGVRRRRECTRCQYRFTTVEEIIPEELKVIKRNGVREDYLVEKLRTGVKNACYISQFPPKCRDKSPCILHFDIIFSIFSTHFPSYL